MLTFVCAVAPDRASVTLRQTISDVDPSPCVPMECVVLLRQGVRGLNYLFWRLLSEKVCVGIQQPLYPAATEWPKDIDARVPGIWIEAVPLAQILPVSDLVAAHLNAINLELTLVLPRLRRWSLGPLCAWMFVGPRPAVCRERRAAFTPETALLATMMAFPAVKTGFAQQLGWLLCALCGHAAAP